MQENVEIVRRIVDAIRDRRWEEATRQLGPDIELHGTAGGLTEGSVWRGPEQIRDFFEQDAEAWDERRLEAEQFIDADDCVVVLLGRLSLELLPPLTFLFISLLDAQRWLPRLVGAFNETRLTNLTHRIGWSRSPVVRQ